VPGKEVLSLEARGGDPAECRALDLAEGAQVLAYEGLSLADGAPVAVFRSVFPAARFAGLLGDLAETTSVTAALARHGVEDYTRLETRLTAVSATATQALHLRLPDGAPLLRTVAINVDGAGRPIEYGHTWFAGDRVTLTVGAP
jgi:GntR family phosphonate transport system transcriptional regulator